MPIGTLLRQAREQAGLSAAQISERTRIQLYKIEALENGEFFLLPDNVYLDGIVRAYARELALEPEPLIERLHCERPPFTLDSIAILKDIHASRKRKGRGREPWKPITIDLPRVPIRPQRTGRTTSRGLMIPFLLLLCAAGWGLYVYEATLYDAARLPSDQTVATERPSADVTPPVDAAAPSAAAATYTPIESSLPDASRHDVSGSWQLLALPERSRDAGLNGGHYDYELYLEQDGDRVTGSGRKVTENGRGIRVRAQTSISVAGVINGERLTLAFTELGTRRATEGKFVLLLEGNETMRGRFSSTAAQSSGIVEARRLPDIRH